MFGITKLNFSELPLVNTGVLPQTFYISVYSVFRDVFTLGLTKTVALGSTILSDLIFKIKIFFIKVIVYIILLYSV